MATTSTNLGLTIPALGDAPDIQPIAHDFEIIDQKVVKRPDTNPDGTDGQLLRTKGDGTTEWTTQGAPTDAQVEAQVSAWLTAHPEATTTVQDGAITRAKLDNDLKTKTDLGAIAPVFAEATAYAAGTYVMKDGAMYLLPNGHTANTTWANTTKTAVTAGDQITDLKSAIYANVPLQFYNGYFGAGGGISQQSDSDLELFTNLISLDEFPGALHVSLSYTEQRSMWLCYVSYDASGAFIKRQVLKNESATSYEEDVTFGSTAQYARFMFRSFGDATFSVKASLASKELLPRISELEDVGLSFNEHPGYISSEGSIYEQDSSAKENYTDLISLDMYDISVISLNYSTSRNMWFAYCLYDKDGAFISRTLIVDKVNYYSYLILGSQLSIPSNAKFIVFTFRTYNDQTFKVYGKIKIPELSEMVNKLYPHNDEAKVIVKEYPGYIGANGTIYKGQDVTKLEVYTNKIPVKEYSVLDIALSYTEQRAMWLCYGTFDKNGNALGRTIIVNETKETYEGPVAGFASNAAYIVFSFRSFGEAVFSVTGTKTNAKNTYTVEDVEHKADNNTEEIWKVKKNANLSVNPLRFKACYDHLFVGRHQDAIIPHESVFHVRVSKAFGFNVIEGNIWSTSDNVLIVNHLNDGKFGSWFHHVDGETDISNIKVSTVTWEWIEENVRYNSVIQKYQVRPTTLAEFMSECRQQNIIPFLTISNNANATIVRKAMGQNNFIAYRGTREICPSDIIYQWNNLETKADIISYCESFGPPFIYGMSNPTSFTDSELQDIIDTLHSMGYWIGTSYADDLWYKYSYMGFDINGTQTLINRIERGNLFNLHAMNGFDDFIVSGATETNGVLTFTSAGTITPDIENTSHDFCGIDIEIVFDGSVTLQAIGERKSNTTYTSDGSYPVFVCVPIVNGSPKFALSCSLGTTVYDLQFKASAF